MLDFVAVGDVMLDLWLPSAEPGERVHAPIEARAGGSAVNAARGGARLGAAAAVVGAVGDDMLGRAIADELAAEGLEVHFQLGPGRTGTTVYGDAVIADRGANAEAIVAWLPDARVTLVSGYLPERARSGAVAVASGLCAFDLQGVLDDAPGVEVVLGPSLDLDALATRHRVVVSTLGRDGAEAIADGVRARVEPVRVLPGTLVGAGDAFAAAFLLALADGLPLVECLRRGCASVEDAVAERHQRDARRE